MRGITRPKKLTKLASLVAISALLIIFALQKLILDSSPESVRPTPRMRSYLWMPLSQWFFFHAEDVALAETSESKILFLGDSLVQNWSETQVWNKHFKSLAALNFGISGDLTQNLLWRLENGAVGNLNPEKIILQIGTNNLSSSNKETSQEIAQGVIAVVNKLQIAFPEAKILLMAVFPREKEAEHPYRNKIQRLNQHLEILQDLEHLTYLDMGNQFLLSDGTLSQELMPDALHLSEKGYEIWGNAILQWMKSFEK
ncbi:MAG: GDSL-type esterase/lipase family protein [Pleurocapsa sp.]